MKTTVAANLAIFVQGAEIWNKHHLNNETDIDLSEIDFTDREKFAKYLDSTGSLNYKDVRFLNCNLTSSKFVECNLTNSVFQNANVSLSDFTGATLDHADFDGAIAVETKFNMVNAAYARFRTCNLSKATLSSGHFDYALFTRAILTDTNIRYASFIGADFTNLDKYFSRWKTNLWGKPEFPDYPNTAVDLIIGLNPHTKKMISDGLYLRSLINKAENNWSKLALRLWGISCGYGQDIGRWMIFSGLLISIFACLFTTVDMNVATLDIASHSVKSLVVKPDFFTSLYYSIITFVTLGYGDIFPVTNCGRAIAMVEVCIGYLMLGGLVSIFSNKLARLS